MKPDYNQAWSLISTALRLAEVTAPSAAQIGENTLALYAKDRTGVSSLYFKDDAGVEHDLGALTSAAALTRVNDTNVTATLTGTPATALLQAVTVTLGWAGTLAETRGGTAQGTYTLGDILYSSASNTLSKLAGNITTTMKILTQTGSGAVSAAPAWTALSALAGEALSKANDTNVTLTLTGSPTTALLAATTITAGWTGTLSAARGGTGVGALANVTAASSKITLGGTPTGAVVNAFSIDVNQANLDHGSIGGLSDDDHAQYALLAGRSGGQVLIGGTAAADDLTFQTTSGVGVGSDTFIFKLGSNGATTVATLSHVSSYGLLNVNGASGSQLELAVGGTKKWLTYTDGTVYSIYDSTNSLDALIINASQNVSIPNGTLTVSTVIGGTAAGDDLTLQATSGAGAGSENIIFLVGNAGATEAARFVHTGQLQMGSAQSAVTKVTGPSPPSQTSIAPSSMSTIRRVKG